MGKFIIIEGPDFCGKSTQINLYDLNKAHRDQDIFFTREPGSFLPQSDDICEAIRDKILYGDNTPYEEAALFAESRYYHTKDIMRLFNKYPKVNIISDRYIVSSLAYQGYARNLGIEEVYAINMYATSGFLPELTIYIDIPVEVGLERIAKNNRDVNRLDLEKVSFHNRVREGYLKIAEMFPDRIVKIDGIGTPEEVYERVQKVIFERL